MRKKVLAILSGVAIVASTLTLVPDEAAASREEEASGVAADLGVADSAAVVSEAADLAVVDSEGAMAGQDSRERRI